MSIFLRFLSVLATVASLAPSVASAMQPLELDPPDEAVNFGAVVIGVVPDYPGSDETTVGLAPMASWSFAKGRSIQLVATELSLDLAPGDVWRFGPVVNYRFGRDDQVRDPVVRLLEPIDGILEGGLTAGYSLRLGEDPRHRLNFGADLVADFGGVYKGWMGAVRVNYLRPLSRGVLGYAGAGVRFADAGFTRTYFGVEGGDRAFFPSLGGAAYRPGGGLMDVRIGVGLIAHLSTRWHVLAGGQWSRLASSPGDSPLVDERGDCNQWIWGGGVGFVF